MSRLRLLLLLGGLVALGPLSIDAYLPAFPAMAADLGASPARVQLTLAAYLSAMAVGQLLVGPLSDTWGRRRPVLVALAAYALASLACAASPSAEVLVVLRVVQGVAGGAGVVIGRAVVRDLYAGSEATRFYSRLTLVFGVAPVLAPTMGGVLLVVTGWRGIFAMLAVLGLLLLAAVAAGLPETLQPERRRPPRLRSMVTTMGGLLADRPFLGFSLAQALGFAGMFAYIAGSPFAVQGVYGASPQLYALLFGLNAAGFVAAGQVSGALAGRVPERRTLRFAQALGLTASASLVGVTLTRVGGLPAVAACLFVFVTSLGLVMPNATSLASARRPDAAGSAAALIGFLQSLAGACAAPLVGLGPTGTAVPMAVVVAGFAVAAASALAFLARGALDT